MYYVDPSGHQPQCVKDAAAKAIAEGADAEEAYRKAYQKHSKDKLKTKEGYQMENVDEKIIKQRAAMEEFERQRFSKETIEEENKQSIFEGTIEVNKIPIRFARRPLFDGQVEIWMPQDFEELSRENIDAIYLLGNKPDMVFGNSYLNFSVGFHYTENEVPDEYMGEFGKLARMILEKMGPKTNIYAQKAKVKGKHTISWLELTSHTVTDVVYNMMFFSSLKGRVLIGFINFHYQFLARYKRIADEMLESFQFIEED